MRKVIFIMRKVSHRYIGLISTSITVLLLVFVTEFCVSPAVVQANTDTPFVIVLDPGHGGIDGGASSEDGYLEKTLNLDIAKKLKAALEKKGYQVFLTREEDTDCTMHVPESASSSRHRRDLMGRVQFVKEHQANLLVSIHANIGTKTNRGPIVICQPHSHNSQYAAQLVQRQFNQVTGIAQHTVTRKHLYVLSHSPAPVILVEVGFLSNPSEVAQLKTNQYQVKLVQAMVSGISEYFLTGFPHMPKGFEIEHKAE